MDAVDVERPKRLSNGTSPLGLQIINFVVKCCGSGNDGKGERL